MKAGTIYFVTGGLFCIAILAGVFQADQPEIGVVALLLTLAVMAITYQSAYRGFYVLCFGEGAVLAVFPSFPGAGLLAQLVLVALFLYSTGVPVERTEVFTFLAYSLVIASLGMVLIPYPGPGRLLLFSVLLSGAGIIILLLNEHRQRVAVMENLDEKTPV